MGKLRLEVPAVAQVNLETTTSAVTAAVAAKPALVRPVTTDTVEHWRKMALSTSDRLAAAENQLKDLRSTADDLRAQLRKSKDRQDSGFARVNELQVQVVQLAAALEEARGQLARQEVLAQKVHAYRESILHGELWELFAELTVLQSAGQAGGSAI